MKKIIPIIMTITMMMSVGAFAWEEDPRLQEHLQIIDRFLALKGDRKERAIERCIEEHWDEIIAKIKQDAGVKDGNK